jgi:uncharacterized protein with HEPN domain
MKRSYREFLQDILDAITEIEFFINGISFEEFQLNREKILAVVKLLENIGEAVKNIPKEQRQLYPSIPWQSIAGMRNILAHQYWQVDITVTWETVTVFLPSLKTVTSDILNQEII